MIGIGGARVGSTSIGIEAEAAACAGTGAAAAGPEHVEGDLVGGRLDGGLRRRGRVAGGASMVISSAEGTGVLVVAATGAMAGALAALSTSATELDLTLFGDRLPPSRRRNASDRGMSPLPLVSASSEAIADLMSAARLACGSPMTLRMKSATSLSLAGSPRPRPI